MGEQTNEGVPVRGFFRLKIGEDTETGTKIVGDSGWRKNEVTNDGYSDYIIGCLAAIAGSSTIGHIQIGTGTAPASNHTALDGSTISGTCDKSVVATKTLQCTVAFASGDHPGGTPNIRNIALANTNAATIACGNTFSSSTWNNNQGVSATYQLRFGTA